MKFLKKKHKKIDFSILENAFQSAPLFGTDSRYANQPSLAAVFQQQDTEAMDVDEIESGSSTNEIQTDF